MSVSAEDHEKVVKAIEVRLEIGMRAVTSYGDDERMLFDAYRLLSSGGAPARPTREALIAAIAAHDFGPHIEAAKGRDDHGSAAFDGTEALADALLADDHLWAEHPSAPVVDREALAEMLYNAPASDGFDNDLTDTDAALLAGQIIASGVFVDRASVEREAAARALNLAAVDWEALVMREKPPPRGSVWLSRRAAEYREGKR